MKLHAWEGSEVLQLGQIDRGDDKPPYRQIANMLRDAISSDQLAAEERLPSEAELIQHFGVARMTIRQAIQLLRVEGLVASQHGRGVFVCPVQPIHEDSSTDRRGPLGVVFNEQSRKIHVGTMNEAHDELLDEMEDVTSTAVVAVADYVFAGTGAVDVNLDDGSAYRIEVVKIGSPSRSGHRIALLPGSAIVEVR